MKKDDPNVNFIIKHIPILFSPIIMVIIIAIVPNRLFITICLSALLIIQGVIYLFSRIIYITENYLLKKWMKNILGLWWIGIGVYFLKLKA